MSREVKLKCDVCGMSSVFVGEDRHRSTLQGQFLAVHARCRSSDGKVVPIRRKKARPREATASLLPEHWVMGTTDLGEFRCACGERVEPGRWAHHDIPF